MKLEEVEAEEGCPSISVAFRMTSHVCALILPPLVSCCAGVNISGPILYDTVTAYHNGCNKL